MQIYGYKNYGFNSTLDAVQIWLVTLTSTTLVHRVELTLALQGHTFTYDPSTGFLDSFSVPGENGAFKAVETDDVGSPGSTTGLVPLAIIRQPADQTVDGGTPAIFSVQVAGLPRPRYQWRRNGADISGAVSNVFEIPTATPVHAGSYTVTLDNGLGTKVSMPALLQVNTISNSPSVDSAPLDVIVAPGQTATFQVTARGYEPPSFQWQFKGKNILGATNDTYNVTQASEDHAGVYSVRIQNSLGVTNAAAVLTVRPKPKLVVTEICGSRSTNTTIFGRADWWELTNFDTYAVSLRGYRFDDNPGVVENSVVITNEVVIQPGESVLFIKDITPEFFTEWWGEENLPQNVQFVRYAGNGFNALGDSVWLWNATPTDRLDWIQQVDYYQDLNWDFTPISGPSRTFWCGGCDELGSASVVGEWGAIRAARSEDVGSPGYVTNHPPRTVAPRFLVMSHSDQSARLTWKTQAGKSYELQSKDHLDAPKWTPLTQHTAAGAQLIITDSTVASTARRFYRMNVLPNSP